MYGFDNNTSKIDALAKHTVAEIYSEERMLAHLQSTLWYVQN